MTASLDSAPLLTAQGVADLLGVPRSWVYDNYRSLGIPALKLGAHLRFRRDAVVVWAESRRVEGVA